MVLSNLRSSGCVGSCWLFLTVACLVNCGCGETPESAGQQSASSQPTGVIDAKEALSTSNGSAETDTGAPVSGPQNVADVAEVDAGDTAAATQSEKPKSAAAGTAAGSSPKTVRRVEPSPEQLARWAPLEFEPLQLLACRESSSIGFVASMAQTDGKHFILAGTSVTLWSIEADAPEYVFLELTDEQSIKSLAVSPDGKWFAAGDTEGTLRIWSISDRTELHSKKLYSSGITQIAISPDSKEIATISYDAEITIWSADELVQQQQFKVDTSGLERIEYMSPESLVAAGETTSSWNVRTAQLETQLSPGRYNFTLARSPDGGRFLFGEEDVLKLWNVADGKVEAVLKGGFATKELIAFAADGKFLATANGSSIRIWDIASGQLAQIIDAFGWPITGLSWLPETNLLVVASANGRTRIWGSIANGESLGLQAMHAAVAMPDGSSKEPANPAQLLQTMDLRTFPRLAEGVARANDAFDLSYEVAVSPDEAQLFYRYQLGKAGWEEVAAATPTPGSIQFQRGGFMISASFYEAAASKTSVSVNFGGNYDLRWVPKFDAVPVELVFENENIVMYRTKADVIQIETALLRKLHEAGWTAYSRLHAAQSEQPESRDLEFLRNGITLRVSIGPFPADPATNSVQYSKFLTDKSIPVPLDSGFVEFDGATQPYLVATTAMTLEQAREFYDKELAAQGWLARDYGRSLKDDDNWLSYIRDQQDLTVGLQTMPTGRTLVRVGDELEDSSWQLAKPEEPAAAETTIAGMEASDFPILNESKSAKFDAIGKSIEFSMETMPLPEIGDHYTKQLLSLSWQKDGDGITSDDYVFLTFVKDEAEVELRARVTDGKSIVNIQGDGLLWTKPLPGGKTVISYATWLRINHHPATLDLLDEYEAEMKSIAMPVTGLRKPE